MIAGGLRHEPDRASSVFEWLKTWRGEIAEGKVNELGESEDFCRWIWPYFQRAIPFIWTAPMWNIGLEAALTMPEIPAGDRLEMPFDEMLFAWKSELTLLDLALYTDDIKPLPGQTKEEAAQKMEVFWELIFRRDENSATSIVFGGDYSRPAPDDTGKNRLVWYKKADWTTKDDRNSRLFSGLFRWLESPYITYTYPGVEHESRAERKRIERAVEDLPPPMTEPRFIRLRRALIKKQAEEQGHDVHWSHQWLVSGHWRDQWLPSSISHRMTWIAPYVKGPPGLPLKTPARLITR